MATAKPPPLPRKPRAARRYRWRTWLLLALAVLVLALVAFWRPINGYADAGASYGARVACSCRFVAGRSLADCRKDFVAGMGMVMLSEDTAQQRVTARFPLLSRQSARFRAGEGCVLDKWED